MFLRLLSPNNSSPTLCDINRRPFSKMAAAKPEVVLSRVTDVIETWFQRLNLKIWCRWTQIIRHRHCATSTDNRFLRWRPSNRKLYYLILRYRRDRHAFSTSKPMFSRSLNSKNSSPTPCDIDRRPISRWRLSNRKLHYLAFQTW